jgi:enoyl-CoA hydratase
MLHTGDDRVSARDALAMGLISDVVPNDRLLDEALSVAERIAGNDPLAVKLTKQAINRSLDIAGLRQALAQALEIDVLIESTDSPEKREFEAVLRRDGVKAALAWRAARAAAVTHEKQK